MLASWSLQVESIFNNLQHLEYSGGEGAGISGFFFTSVNTAANVLFGTGLKSDSDLPKKIILFASMKAL